MRSNGWDMLAIASDGTTDGIFTTPYGVRLYIHENWLYVYDRQAWRDRRHRKGSVMEIHHGQLTYLDLEIRAIHGPQDGIYVVASTGSWFGGTFAAMVGCGVFGWAPEIDQLLESPEAPEPSWIGVSQEAALFLRQYVRRFDDVFPDGHPFLGEKIWADVWPVDTASEESL